MSALGHKLERRSLRACLRLPRPLEKEKPIRYNRFQLAGDMSYASREELLSNWKIDDLREVGNSEIGIKELVLKGSLSES